MRVGINGRHIHSAGVTDPERCKECRPPVSGEPPIHKPGCILDDRAHDVPCIVEEACWTCGHLIAVEWDEDGTPRNVKPIEASTGAALDVTLMRRAMVELDRILDGKKPRDWPLADQIVAAYERELARLAEQEGEGRGS